MLVAFGQKILKLIFERLRDLKIPIICYSFQPKTP